MTDSAEFDMTEIYGLSLPYKWKFDKKALTGSNTKANPFDLSCYTDKNSGIWKEETLITELGVGKPIELRGSFNYCGLENKGATCYVNSLLQSLFFIPEFTSLVLSLDTSNDSRLRVFQTLWGELHSGVKQTVNPEGFLSAFAIQMHLQEDATEFCTLLLNWLDESLPVRALFEGEMVHSTTCSACNVSTDRVETFLELRLDISSNSASSSIEELLQAYLLKEEPIEGYTCPSCGNGPGVCQSRISKIPKYFRIVLNRYTYSLEDGRDKLSVPISIDLDSFLYEEYRCLSILEHHSLRASSGHYTAHLRDTQWFTFDDTVVKRVGNEKSTKWLPNKCVSNSAYMMVYGNSSSLSISVNPWLSEEIARLNRLVIEENMKIDFDRKSILSKIKSRQEYIEKIIENTGTEIFAVNTNSLKTFIKGSDLLNSSNDFFMLPKCMHDKLSPLEVHRGNIKYVSLPIEELSTKLASPVEMCLHRRNIECVPTKFGPPVKELMCSACCKEIKHNIDLAELFVLKLSELHSAKFEFANTENECVWVQGLPRKILLTSRQMWMNKLVQISGREVANIDITEGTVCKHSNLLPSVLTDPSIVLKPKKLILDIVSISNELCKVFKTIPRISAANFHGASDQGGCIKCDTEVESMIDTKKKFQNLLPTVMESTIPKFTVGETFYIYLANWISKLGNFLLSDSRKIGKSSDSLFCPHGDIKVNVLENQSDKRIVYISEKEEEYLTEFCTKFEIEKFLPGIIFRDNSYVLGTAPAICPLCAVPDEGAVLSVRVFYEPIDRLLASGCNKSIRMNLHETTVMYRPGRSRLVGSTSGFDANSTGLDAKLLLMNIGILASAPTPLNDENEGLERMNIYIHHPTMRGSLVQLRDETSVTEMLCKFQENVSIDKLDTLFVEFIVDPTDTKKSVKKRKTVTDDKDAGLQGSIFRSSPKPKEKTVDEAPVVLD